MLQDKTDQSISTWFASGAMGIKTRHEKKSKRKEERLIVFSYLSTDIIYTYSDSITENTFISAQNKYLIIITNKVSLQLMILLIDIIWIHKHNQNLSKSRSQLLNYNKTSMNTIENYKRNCK